MNNIFIEGLKVFGYHGVFEEEKRDGQPFIVDCNMKVDMENAYTYDALDKTVNYADVCLYIGEYFKNKRHDLLETVADELATELLLAFSAIKSLTLKINKPEAPIPMEFSGVGVSITKGWTRCAISLGSNMGDKHAYIDKAIATICDNDHIRGLSVSNAIETEPYGYLDQSKFINRAAVFETVYSPRQLLDFMHEIEDAALRKREIHWGPRTLDLDLLLYGNQSIEKDGLIVPHIDMCNRDFVLDPLNEIAPAMVHPVRNATVRQLWEELNYKDF